MGRATGFVLACVLVGSYSAAARTGAEPEDVLEQTLEAGEQAAIAPLDYERPAVFRLSTGTARLTIRATPDGMVQLADVGVDLRVSARGSEGNEVSFLLPQGGSVAIWPVERVVVTGGAREYSLDVTAAGWAFVVRADRVGRRGLAVLCDGIKCLLYDGQRVDADRKGSEVAFRVTRKRYPGEFVVKPIVREGPVESDLPPPDRGAGKARRERRSRRLPHCGA